MQDATVVFDAVRRGYSDLQDASPQEICRHFSDINPESFSGHVSNVKGIVFEQMVVDSLENHGIHADVFEATNHPDTDIFVFEDSDSIAEFQLKATDSVQYIASTLEDNPDIPIITTSEVADHFSDNDLVFDSGISNEDLSDFVSDTLATGTAFPIEDDISEDVIDELLDTVADATLPFPISPLGLLFSFLL